MKPNNLKNIIIELLSTHQDQSKNDRLLKEYLKNCIITYEDLFQELQTQKG